VTARRICPQCGTEYSDELRFCPRDGTALRPLEPSSDLVGEIIADRYHVTRKLGEGGMGEVYLAEHVKMGRPCALKVIRHALVHDADALARFTREAGNASRITHPNVAAIYDFGETPDGVVFLAMEYVEGESLQSLLRREGSLPPERVVAIVRQVAAALADAHALGIVHRDLKPENIMIGRSRDGGDLVKVVDFGIAKAVTGDRQQVTKTGFVLGTPDYMSPEQLAGEPLGGQSDQYALALVAFQMLTGKLPFAGKTEHEVLVKRLTAEPLKLVEARPDLTWPAGLQAVFDRALARRPEDRFPSVTDFAEALAAAYGIATPAAPGQAAVSRSSRRSFGRGLLVGSLVAVLAASAAMVTLTWRMMARNSEAATAADSSPSQPPGAVAPSAPPRGEGPGSGSRGTAALPRAAPGTAAAGTSAASGSQADSARQIVIVLPESGGGRSDRPRGRGFLIPELSTRTGNPALDSAMAAVRRGLQVVDSIAKLDPEAFRELRRVAPGGGVRPRREPEPPASDAELRSRQRSADLALEAIENLIDAAVTGHVPEPELLRARQALESIEREPLSLAARLRAQADRLMLQALITKSEADCAALHNLQTGARHSRDQLQRLRAVVAKVCGT
jgi:serine/threonine-protein kinase